MWVAMRRSMVSDWYRAVAVHAICGVLHILSTVFIVTYALAPNGRRLADYNTYVNKDFFAYTDWATSCYNDTSNAYSRDPVVIEACTDNNTLYFIDQENNNAAYFSLPVNILLLAMAFTATSGLVHFISAAKIYQAKELDLRADAWLRLCADYAVSAPCMLVVVNVTYGANSVSGVIAAPLLLAVLLVVSHYLLSSSVAPAPGAGRALGPWSAQPRFPRHAPRARAFLLFGLLIALYAVSLLPTIIAVGKIGSVAPPGVVVFLSGMLVAYSSFIVPYAYELAVGRYCFFVAYAALSVIAKAMLHAFLAVSVLQQSQLYSNAGVATGSPGDMGDETTAYMIITIIPLSGIALFTLIRRYLNPLQATTATEMLTYLL